MYQINLLLALTASTRAITATATTTINKFESNHNKRPNNKQNKPEAARTTSTG